MQQDFLTRLENGATIEPGPGTIERKEKIVKGKKKVWVKVK